MLKSESLLQQVTSIISTKKLFQDIENKKDNSKKSHKVKPLTIPKPFHFSEISKRKTKDNEFRIRTEKTIKKKYNSIRNGLTIPKPFSFDKVDNLDNKKCNNSFVSRDLQVNMFEAKTPEKFKTSVKKRAINIRKTKLKLTKARSPILLTKIRVRPSKLKSYDELELEDFIKQPKFHANPLNPKIFQKPIGIPSPEKKPLTIPHSPVIKKPSSHDNIPPSSPQITYTFKSKSFTNPKPFKPIIPSEVNTSQVIETVPFLLPGEEISKNKLRQFQERIEKEKREAEQLRCFIANPIPEAIINEKSVKHHKPSPPPLIQPKPFKLITEERGQLYQKEFNERIAEEMEKEENNRRFKAHPAQSIKKMPFIAMKSEKPLTEFEEVNLQTERRAEERKKFEEQLKQKEIHILQLQKEQMEYQKMYEKKLLKQDRKNRVHHAKPAPHFIFNQANVFNDGKSNTNTIKQKEKTIEKEKRYK